MMYGTGGDLGLLLSLLLRLISASDLAFSRYFRKIIFEVVLEICKLVVCHAMAPFSFLHDALDNALSSRGIQPVGL